MGAYMVTEANPMTAEKSMVFVITILLLPVLHPLHPSLTIRAVFLAHFSPIKRNSLYLAAGLYTNYFTVLQKSTKMKKKKLFLFAIF